MVEKKKIKKSKTTSSKSKKETLDVKAFTKQHKKQHKNETKLEDSKKTSSKKIDEEDDQPSWYHYVIVLAVAFGALFIIYSSVNFFAENNTPVPVDNSSQFVSKYISKNKIGNVTYNVEISLPESDLFSLGYQNQITHLGLLNTLKYTFAFDTYNGTDNGFVSISAIKLRRYLSTVYYANFENTSFQDFPEYSCANSTYSNRIIELRVHQNQSGIFEGENGCIILSSTNAKTLPWVVDYFMVSLLKDEARNF